MRVSGAAFGAERLQMNFSSPCLPQPLRLPLARLQASSESDKKPLLCGDGPCSVCLLVHPHFPFPLFLSQDGKYKSVCVCVCVCKREWERAGCLCQLSRNPSLMKSFLSPIVSVYFVLPLFCIIYVHIGMFERVFEWVSAPAICDWDNKFHKLMMLLRTDFWSHAKFISYSLCVKAFGFLNIAL